MRAERPTTDDAVMLATTPAPKRWRRKVVGRPLTMRETILVAVWEWMGTTPLAVAEIVLLAWRMNPEMFGLKGYEEKHPDTNKVLAKLSGKGNLSAWGWMERTAPAVWRVTEKGWSEAQRLAKRARML